MADSTRAFEWKIRVLASLRMDFPLHSAVFVFSIDFPQET